MVTPAALAGLDRREGGRGGNGLPVSEVSARLLVMRELHAMIGVVSTVVSAPHAEVRTHEDEN